MHSCSRSQIDSFDSRALNENCVVAEMNWKDENRPTYYMLIEEKESCIYTMETDVSALRRLDIEQAHKLN
jgi:hypothetical protein